MYFSDEEIAILERLLWADERSNCREYFLANLQIRGCERNIWEDTPIAKLFTSKDEWYLISSRSILKNIHRALRKAMIKDDNLKPLEIFDAFDTEKEDVWVMRRF